MTKAPLELVNWTNEKGTRFRSAMMGSWVHAGDMTLEQALTVRDDDDVSVAEALAICPEGRVLAMICACGPKSRPRRLGASRR